MNRSLVLELFKTYSLNEKLSRPKLKKFSVSLFLRSFLCSSSELLSYFVATESVSEAWGVKIEAILIKDIVFSRELQESLSSAAQQKRIGESKVIAARAEVDAARVSSTSLPMLFLCLFFLCSLL
jgi:regulator of protease activity HflC (stomatin/prohibitin superfamily)